MRLGPRARWLSTVAMLTAALIVLRHLGGAELDPPSASLEGLREWLATRDGVTAAFALVRLAAIAGAGYLLAVALLGGLASAVNPRLGQTVVHRSTTRPVRALMGSLGIAVVVTAAPPAFAATGQPSTPTTASITRVRPDGEPTSTAVIRLTPPDTVPGATAPAPAPSPPTSSATVSSSEAYTVMPGDSFWSVATDRLRDATGHAHVDDAEIVRYWQTLLEANPLPNPSLLFAGQVIELPPVSS